MKDNLSYENMDECMKHGIFWGCDKDCPVYQREECELQEEVKEMLGE